MTNPGRGHNVAALARLAPEGSLFGHLRAAAGEDWRRYTGHEFVRRVGDGTLPEPCFRHYLGQDYLFLFHFARAYALAAFKSDSFDDLRSASAALAALLDEVRLHVRACARWGMSERDLAALPEATETLAYTRYVLETGMAGDLLDFHAALAACVVGYAEVGAGLAAAPATRLEGNPYREWIEAYAGEPYQAVAREEVSRLERLAAARLGSNWRASPRLERLTAIFRETTRREAAFWDMALNARP
ncbi:MAG: TenA family protein [Alphaproteobacteria bacterium]